MVLKLRLVAQGSGIADGLKRTETLANKWEVKDFAADEPADNILASEAPTQALPTWG